MARSDGEYASARGHQCVASGICATAEGKECVASGEASHAEGWASTASAESSHAEGTSTTQAELSHAEGLSIIIGGVGSGMNHAECNSTINASSSLCHSEGQGVILANSIGCHAEGSSTASGNQSHAEGFNCIASGNSSHAEGGGTIASGAASHSEGAASIASRDSQHSLSSGQANNGTAQFCFLHYVGTTNDASNLILTNGGGGTAFNLEVNRAYVFRGMIVARDDSAAPANISTWKFEGAMKMSAVGSAVLLGPCVPALIAQDAGAAGFTVAIAIDVTGNLLEITVNQGGVGFTVNWSAVLEWVEVQTTPA